METPNIKSFANELKSQLPPILREVVLKTSSDAEADLMLIGAITTLSAALPNVYGIYDENVVYPARAGTGQRRHGDVEQVAIYVERRQARNRAGSARQGDHVAQ